MTAATIIGTPQAIHIAGYTGTEETVSLAPESGSDRKCYAVLGYETGSTAATFTVTWDGVSFSEILVIEEDDGGSAENGIRVLELLETDFPSTTADLVYDSDTNLGNNLGIFIIQVQDADQAQAVDEASASATNSYSLSVTDAESLVLQFLSSGGTGTYAIDSPATEVDTAESAGDFRFGFGKIDDRTSGSVTLNATGTDTTRRVHAAIAVPPASPSAGGSVGSPVVVIV